MIETLERNMSKQIRISDRLYNHLKAKKVTMSKYLDGLVFEDNEFPKWFENPLEYRSSFSKTIDNRIFNYLRKEILTLKDDKYYLAKQLSRSVVSQVETILALQPAKDIRLSSIKFD